MISPLRLLRGLLAIDFGVALLYVLSWNPPVPSYTLTRLVNMDAEASAVTWYSSAQLLLTAVCWFLIASRTDDRLYARNARVLGLFFLFLSIEETVDLHVAVSLQLARFTGDRFPVTGPWFFIGVPILALTYVAWKKTVRLGEARNCLALGVAMIVLSATGIEALANLTAVGSLPYRLEVLFEETGELAGMSTCLYGSYRAWLRLGAASESAQTPDAGLLHR